MSLSKVDAMKTQTHKEFLAGLPKSLSFSKMSGEKVDVPRKFIHAYHTSGSFAEHLPAPLGYFEWMEYGGWLITVLGDVEAFGPTRLSVKRLNRVSMV